MGNLTVLSCDDGLTGVPLDVPLQQPPVLAPRDVTRSDMGAHTLLQNLDEKVRSPHQQPIDQEDHGSKGLCSLGGVCVVPVLRWQVERLLAAVQGSPLLSLTPNVASGTKVLMPTQEMVLPLDLSEMIPSQDACSRLHVCLAGGTSGCLKVEEWMTSVRGLLVDHEALQASCKHGR